MDFDGKPEEEPETTSEEYIPEYPQKMPEKIKEILEKRIAPYFRITSLNDTQVLLKMKFKNNQDSPAMAKALQALTSTFNNKPDLSDVIGGLFFIP